MAKFLKSPLTNKFLPESRAPAKMPSQSYFYQDLIKLDQLKRQLSFFELEDQHQEELISIAYQTIHLEVLDFILTQLPQPQRGVFLKHFSKHPHAKELLLFLKSSFKDFERQVKNTARAVENKLIHELQDYEEASWEWLSGE